MKIWHFSVTLIVSFCLTTYSQQIPTDIQISKANIAEKEASGTVIGIFTTTDPDTSNSHIYTISGDDVSHFILAEDTLKSNTIFDYELEKLFTITIESRDADSLTFVKDFDIRVTNVNETPLKIGLSDTTITENNSPNTIIGKFKTTDTDNRDAHLYFLTAGDIAPFSIFRNRLEVTKPLDFENQRTYRITVMSQDWGGLQISQDFTIHVEDANDAPTALHLSDTVLVENSPAGTVIGTLSVTDEDAVDSHTYTVSGVDSDSFAIIGSNLVTVGQFDFESKAVYALEVTTTDKDGAAVSDSFRIVIRNMVETHPGSRLQDSLALVALYDSTGGLTWTYGWNLSQPLDNWHGVRLGDGRVLHLDLSSNNLWGMVPSSIGNLLALLSLDLSDNNLASLLGTVNLKLLEVQGNRLSFTSLVRNLAYLGDSSTYSPQKQYGTSRTYTLSNGQDLTLDLGFRDPDNIYQWYRDGEVLIGKRDSILELHSVAYNRDEGIYYCEVTNSQVPGLTLQSADQRLIIPYSVLASDSLALVALYDSTDGLNWKVQWKFNRPVETWAGITVEGNRVTRIHLPNNNMRGPMPLAIQNLSLNYININDNYLTKLILPKKRIAQPYVRNNYFQFDDIRWNFGQVLNHWSNECRPRLYIFPFANHIRAAGFYSPQRSLRRGRYYKKFTYTGNDSLDLTVICRGSPYHFYHAGESALYPTRGNMYGWYKNSNRLWSENNPLLEQNNLQPENEGVFVCRVTNEFLYLRSSYRICIKGIRQFIIYDVGNNLLAQQTAPISLWSSPDTLVVETLKPSDYAVLKDLYAQTDGDNWTNSWDTVMNGSHKWHGVELTADGRRVRGLRLQIII